MRLASALPVLASKLGGRAHTNDLVGRQRPGTQSQLVPATVHLGNQLTQERPANAERADTLRAVDLVSTDRDEIRCSGDIVSSAAAPHPGRRPHGRVLPAHGSRGPSAAMSVIVPVSLLTSIRDTSDGLWSKRSRETSLRLPLP